MTTKALNTIEKLYPTQQESDLLLASQNCYKIRNFSTLARDSKTLCLAP